MIRPTTIRVYRHWPSRTDDVVVQYERTTHYLGERETAYHVLVDSKHVGTVERSTGRRSWPVSKGSRLVRHGKLHHTWNYSPRTNRYARAYDTRQQATAALLAEWLDGTIKDGKAAKGQVNYG